MEGSTVTEGICVKKTAAIRGLFKRIETNMDSVGRDMPEAFRDVYEWMIRNRIPFAPDMGCIAFYPDMEFTPERFAAEVGFPVNGAAPASEDIRERTLPEATVASVLHVGPYTDLGAAYEALMSWIAAEKKTIAGPFREFYLNDPAVVPESELKTEIHVPVL
jgi:effector-binding domain-containing protein